MKSFFNYILLLLVFTVCSAKTKAVEDIQIRSGNATLTIVKQTGGKFWVKIQSDNDNFWYEQTDPLNAEIINSQGITWISAPYQQAERLSDTSIICSGSLTSTNGTEILFTDTYGFSVDNGVFEMSRTTKILKTGTNDSGFSTRMSFQKNTASPIKNYDVFVPGVWYKDNAYVTQKSLASNLSDNEFWFREDRLPLPCIMLMDKQSGATFSIVHKDPEGNTFKEEDGLNRIIDERLKFASIGLKNNAHPSIGITYPGSEGERTYVLGASTEKRWAYRSHPIKNGFEQNYNMAFRVSKEENFNAAVKNTWTTYFRLFSPEIYSCNIETIYNQQIGVLDKYWKSVNGAAGVPFRILLNGQIESENDYNFNMGFVGHEPGNAFLLIREGLKNNSPTLLSKGEQMADFWANESVAPSGCPRTWYDPYPKTWRGPEVALREIGDGMVELLRAWNYERLYNRNKSNWLAACSRVADWVVSVQQANGSFYSHYNYNTGIYTKTHTNCTSHIIPFLVEMHMATQNDTYRTAALKAGKFIYDDIMKYYAYVGGAIDNPNIMDKEAGSMAFRAFLALYDLDNSQKWMDAFLQSVYFYQTWIVCWDIPIPADDKQAIFPAQRSVVGQSLIATGHSAADTYAAIDALGFYRAYLYTGDEQLLHFSKLVFYNTKQFMNWDPANDPVRGIAEGLFGEAMNICIPRGRGVNYYLPWATYNQLEPIIYFEDIFGNKEIDEIQKTPQNEQIQKINEFFKHRGYSSIPTGIEKARTKDISLNYNWITGNLCVSSEQAIEALYIFDIRSRCLFSRNNLRHGYNEIKIPYLVPGLYIVKLNTGDGPSMHKVFVNNHFS